jgi:hypothetical protein
VDLRPLCSKVEDQGQPGSYTANALAGALEFLEVKGKAKGHFHDFPTPLHTRFFHNPRHPQFFLSGHGTLQGGSIPFFIPKIFCWESLGP